MPDNLSGFPYWELVFDETGGRTSVPAAASLAADLSSGGVTDLMVFSHGWNNSPQAARDFYTSFFATMAPFTTAAAGQPRVRQQATIGVSGVIWPSMRWIDEAVPGAASSPAAALSTPAMPTGAAAVDDSAVVQALGNVFTKPAQRTALTELGQLLKQRPNDDAALARFQSLFATLAPQPQAAAPEDQGERALMEKDYHDVFDRMADAGLQAGVTPRAVGGGAAALGNSLDWLWDGAKQALRQLTYWQMKERAGVVGQQGLGPYLNEVHQAAPSVRLHLLGHSFGARLVSYTLKGLQAPAPAQPSPVKSVTLLQGAFSHFTFAASLPQDNTRSGALNGLQSMVDGPILASFTDKDTAVGILYPWASMVSGQDASAIDDPLYPWGAMGHDGAQAVNASGVPLSAPGTHYPFGSGGFFNLDGNAVIVAGGPPAGAHGDICHPEIAWAVLVGANLAEV